MKINKYFQKQEYFHDFDTFLVKINKCFQKQEYFHDFETFLEKSEKSLDESIKIILWVVIFYRSVTTTHEFFSSRRNRNF